LIPALTRRLEPRNGVFATRAVVCHSCLRPPRP
jgi:hypothetical protein